MSLFKRKPWTGKTELLFSDKALTALILPLFLEQLLSVFVGLSDSIMVAQVGEAAVSAVSLVDSIAILLINIFNGLSVIPFYSHSDTKSRLKCLHPETVPTSRKQKGRKPMV